MTGVFARHGASPHAGAFQGGHCGIDLWERQTETSSSRDSSGRNGVVDGFAYGLSLAMRLVGVLCVLLFRMPDSGLLYFPFLMSFYSEGG
jgi:hypothetical protein